jgi:hypothetical protein
MGYAFAYPMVRGLGKCPVGSYTHYPTISYVPRFRPAWNEINEEGG